MCIDHLPLVITIIMLNNNIKEMETNLINHSKNLFEGARTTSVRYIMSDIAE